MDDIKQLYAEWKSLQPFKAEVQKVWDDKFKLEFNYNSNHLEGNTLTYGQTKLLFMFGETSGNASLKDYEEMKAHNVGLEMTKQEALEKERPLTEAFIRELNRTILVQDYWKNAQTPDGQDIRIQIKVGEYKTRPNSVITATGEVFNYASPEETPAFMTELVSWYNLEAEKGTLSPIELATILHYRYIRIHPFEDGNGRIARLLVNFVLYRHEYPMIIIHSEDKPNYLRILHQCDVEVGLTPSDGANATLNKLQPFVNYLTNCLKRSLVLFIKAAKGESIDEEGDFEKRITMLQRKYSDKAIEKSSSSVQHARKVFFELIAHVEQKIQGFKKMFDSSFKTHIKEEKIIATNKNKRTLKDIDSFLDETKMILHDPKLNHFRLQQDEVIFQFHHCRYAGDNTFDLHFSISIAYLADGCELSNSIIDGAIKQPYNPEILQIEGKKYMDFVCDELIKTFEEKIKHNQA